MEDRDILLKIKRDFTHDEAVQLLNKRIAELEFELGVVKSERDEAKEKSHYIIEEGQTKKVWLKDTLIAEMEVNIRKLHKKLSITSKSKQEWMHKYSVLFNSTKIST